MTQTAAVAAAGYMSGRPFPFACESEGKRLDKTALIMATPHINHLDWHLYYQHVQGILTS